MSYSESSSTSILRPATQNQPGLDTDDEIDSIEVDLKPKRGKSKVYDEFQRYASYQEALKGTNSDKQFFKCKNCPKMLYIEKPKTVSGTIIFVEDCNHNHFRTNGIPDKTKNAILTKYFDEKLSPKKIMRWLRDHLNEGYVEVDAIQLNNFIQQQKKKKADFI
ncbi:hypothetical protein BpHYR1_004950 [Brachionus plicatilis]|uniref:Uncharacterized protein n=1 Tax=Brachionus plicatilis TaxID=10195 RepID=A0A3M7QC80_BRAPC|nr:hypothetical protein BpHYR1_004950 [Brachionus plicatilis]